MKTPKPWTNIELSYNTCEKMLVLGNFPPLIVSRARFCVLPGVVGMVYLRGGKFMRIYEIISLIIAIRFVVYILYLQIY